MPKDAGAGEHLALAKWLYDVKEYELSRAEIDTALGLDPTNNEASMLKTAVYRSIIWSKTPKLPAGDPRNPLATKPVAATGDRRFLDPDQINIIRQKEMQAKERLRRCGWPMTWPSIMPSTAPSTHGRSPRVPDPEKAALIIGNGTDAIAMCESSHEDPIALLEFKHHVQPILASGCATATCHGGTSAGKFTLLSASNTSEAAAYTNFYILSRYQITVGDVLRRTIDRTNPQGSLILQYGLPRANAQAGKHPDVPGFVPAFRTQDGRFQAVLAWISVLVPMAPSTGLISPCPV